jgi:hypothetical protein
VRGETFLGVDATGVQYNGTAEERDDGSIAALLGVSNTLHAYGGSRNDAKKALEKRGSPHEVAVCIEPNS